MEATGNKAEEPYHEGMRKNYIEARPRDSVEISVQQYEFMPEKETIYAMFALRISLFCFKNFLHIALRMLMEKYRKG